MKASEKRKLATTTVPVDQIISGIKILSTLDFKKIISDFESQDMQTKIVDGAVALDDVLKIVGLAVPPVAIAANDLELAIDAERVAVAVVEAIVTIPEVNNFINDVSSNVISFFTKDVPAQFNIKTI